LASRERRLLKSENDHLRHEIIEWRNRDGLMRTVEPVRGEDEGNEDEDDGRWKGGVIGLGGYGVLHASG